MGKVKNLLQKVLDECYAIYEKHGYSAVIDHVNEQQKEGNPDYKDVHDEICRACDNDMPSLSNTCLVCGSQTEPLYFKVVHVGWDNNIKREEIEINAGEYGKIMIFQDDGKLGFIIDVYGNDDHHGTLPVWEEDLAPKEEDEDDDPLSKSKYVNPNDFSQLELEDYLDEWGQYHDEICTELGYDPEDDGSSEMILGDGYYFLTMNQKWYPKCSSMYNEREQAIADYLQI